MIFSETEDKHTFSNFSSHCFLSRLSVVDSGNNDTQSDFYTIEEENYCIYGLKRKTR